MAFSLQINPGFPVSLGLGCAGAHPASGNCSSFPGAAAADPLAGQAMDQRLMMMRQLHMMEPMLELLSAMLGVFAGGSPAPAGLPPAGLPTLAGVQGAPSSGPSSPLSSRPTEASAGRSAPSSSSGMKAGAPPGYRPLTGKIPSGVVAKAKSLLSQPMGSEHPFELDGKRYLARLENHYHPPGFKGGPNGWHKGTTVYVAS